MSASGTEFLFTHLVTNFLEAQEATERSKLQHPDTTPNDKSVKHPDLLERKVFQSTSVQFRVANYQTLLAKYDFTKYSKFVEFRDKLPQKAMAQFQTLINGGKLAAKTSLQAAVDSNDTVSKAFAISIVMTCKS
ncbi:hypothetical protein KIL84_017829 [Mauremys mutica]|uniref:Uncharacterized protein n=1 Tax=Mauremys mutica TaxID=74926 RepID=A0A9D3X7L5_9SAUR|nr:hypothetical protein KIL84_017829 [Mauremys mutica]